MKIPKNDQYVLFGGTFVLANKLQMVADKKVKGISTKQWFLLRNLDDLPLSPPPTITMLAKETDTTRQNTSKMLEVLCKQGYVVLLNNPEDRRSQMVELTPQGKEILKSMAGESKHFFRELFSGIGPEESNAAAKVMIKMIENIQKMQEEME